MKKISRQVLSVILTLTLMLGAFPAVTFAGETDLRESEPQQAKRTILLYDCGVDLETKAGLASYNLRQVLRANFSSDEDIKFIVMTGGAQKWHLESEYLYDPATGESPEEINTVYNQIWEAKGADDPIYGGETHGKMVLIDGDGVLGDGEEAKRTRISDEDYIYYPEWNYYEFDEEKAYKYEWMSDPEVLRAFINFGAENYPAEKYDLILWDHGGGPNGGFGGDLNDSSMGNEELSLDELMDVLSDNKVIDSNGDGIQDGRFDFIDFDACLMGGVEVTLALSDYMDYYIASPETEPGYGQDYEGWLNELGDPYKDDVYNGEGGTFELGKKIVDDFIACYDKEDGSSKKGTLTVTDIRKLLNTKKTTSYGGESGFVEALIILSNIMNSQVFYDSLYYDELRSIKASIEYGDMNYYDLGILLSQLSYVFKEADYDDLIGDEGIRDDNDYTVTAQILTDFLNDPDIFYSRGTRVIRSGEHYYRDADGQMTYGAQGTSGMYIYFAPFSWPEDVSFYNKQMSRVIEKLPSKLDERAEFLHDYSQTMIVYALTLLAGKAVSQMVSEGTDIDTIDYEAVKAHWTSDVSVWGYSTWSNKIEPTINLLDGGEEAAEECLRSLVTVMTDEAVKKDLIDVLPEETADGTAYTVTMNNVRKQAIDSINVNLIAELPVMEEFINSPDHQDYIQRHGVRSENFPIGSVNGSEIIDIDPEDSYEKAIEWLFEPTSKWKIDPIDAKWYALTDAEGNVHVTASKLYLEDNEIDVPVGYPTWEPVEEEDEDGNTVTNFEEEWHFGYLAYFLQEDGTWKLEEVGFMVEEGKFRSIPVSEYQDTIELWPVLMASGWFSYYIPVSASFMLTPETIDKIELEYKDVEDIPEIRDTNGDGEALSLQVVIRNIYEYETDISDIVFDSKRIPITDAEVTLSENEFTYNGKAQNPAIEVVLDGKTLAEDTDYILEWSNTSSKNAGSYTVTAIGKGKYKDEVSASYRILFTDVPADHNYSESVYWALDAGITAGYTSGDKAGTFGVSENITRGQVVMFLWRAAGMPEPTIMTPSFKDVKSSNGFFKAIQWASEKGIAGGYSDKTFRPGEKCTRGQIAMFLWRYENKPNPKKNAQTFKDVPTSHNFYKAIQWAYEQNITKGYGDNTFGVNKNCTRGQCVTFLYRLLK